ncbi:doublecortin domain-containing protein 2 isoform X2 [Alosa alosa]|uniref:doublecortin domain-containing protein 2 isoform X2 n=1 Tax=Alosa alosa TaxID=278164 RepID=UPI0020153B04|nr:doublecortin domain-containing protein 2 isoform X2 [Alosa alosa]
MSGSPGNLMARRPQPPTKTVVMYRNGDAFFTGRKIVINHRQMSTFDSFLSSVTLGIEAPFGAVRNIYTPREGHRILDMEHLQHGEKYVAAGRERFKRLEYLQITTKKPQRKKNELIQPVVHSKIVVPARWRRIINESCTIHVFTNGDILVPPARILIPKYTLTNWDNVLAMVTEKVHLRTGAVYRLCTLDGIPLFSGTELENNQYYVGVGAERFRHLPYFQWVPNKAVSRDMTQGDVLPPLKKMKAGKNVAADCPAPSQGEEPEQAAKGLQALLSGRSGSRFYAKSQAAKQAPEPSRNPPIFSVGDSVFKAKDRRKETAGAAEVEEDRRVRVDLPIDQVKAKTVDEEQCDYPRPESGGRSPIKSFFRRASISKALKTSPANSRAESPASTCVTPDELFSDSKLTNVNGKPEKEPVKPPTKTSVKAPVKAPVTPDMPAGDSKLSTANGKPSKAPVKAPVKAKTKAPVTPEESVQSPVDWPVEWPDVSPQEATEEPKVERRASKLFGIRTRMSKFFKDKNKKETSAPESDAMKPESRAAKLYFPAVNEETTAEESASGSQWEHGEVRSLQRRDNDGLSVNHSHVLGAHITTH